jgi:hypothetical protein
MEHRKHRTFQASLDRLVSDHFGNRTHVCTSFRRCHSRSREEGRPTRVWVAWSLPPWMLRLNITLSKLFLSAWFDTAESRTKFFSDWGRYSSVCGCNPTALRGQSWEWGVVNPPVLALERLDGFSLRTQEYKRVTTMTDVSYQCVDFIPNINC